MSDRVLFNEIEVCEPSELEFSSIASFSFESFVSETSMATGEPIDSLKEKFGGPPTKKFPDDVWLVVNYRGSRVGFVWFQIIEKENTAFGWDIYLEPEFRSKGIGRHVMKLCGEQLIQKGIESVKICVFEHNQIARKLYESLGFEVEKFDEERRQFTLKMNLNNQSAFL